jgi:trk system potassium uptake protein TrkA
MKAVILGCGRVGSMLANFLSGQKWEVAVVDANPDSFTGLDETFPGQRVSGRITDEETLKEAGLDSADLVVVLTSDDIANLMAAQLVRQRFGREKVLVRVRDPIKAGAYRDLGLQTVCPSEIELEMLLKELGLKSEKA